MDNFFLKKSAEYEDGIYIYLIIYLCIVARAILKKEQENSKLALRKKRLNNILLSKRKIDFNNEINSKLNDEYFIDLKDIIIPDEEKIDINKFYQDVNNNLYNIKIIDKHIFIKRLFQISKYKL